MLYMVINVLTSRMAPRSVLNYNDENALKEVINKSIEIYLQIDFEWMKNDGVMGTGLGQVQFQFYQGSHLSLFMCVFLFCFYQNVKSLLPKNTALMAYSLSDCGPIDNFLVILI